MKEDSWWEEGSEEGAAETVSPFAESEGPAGDMPERDDGGSAALGPMLTGDVGMMKTGGGSVFGDTVPVDERPRLPKGAWFAIGLIGVPILISVVSFVFATISEATWEDDEIYDSTSDFSLSEETMEIEGEEFKVYTTKFSDLGKLGELDWGGWISWEGGETHCNVDGSTYVDQNGTIWRGLTCYRYDEYASEPDSDGYVRWAGKVDGAYPDAFTILTQETYKPESMNVWAEVHDINGVSDFFGTMAFLVWPIGGLGFALWGFTKGNSAMAWGVLSSVIVLPLVFLGLCFVMIVVIFGGGGL